MYPVNNDHTDTQWCNGILHPIQENGSRHRLKDTIATAEMRSEEETAAAVLLSPKHSYRHCLSHRTFWSLIPPQGCSPAKDRQASVHVHEAQQACDVADTWCQAKQSSFPVFLRTGHLWGMQLQELVRSLGQVSHGSAVKFRITSHYREMSHHLYTSRTTSPQPQGLSCPVPGHDVY
ncbi:hypothetical protein COCON_G00056160, partial [Conger conger]